MDFRRAITWNEALPAFAVCAVLSTGALLHLALAPAAVAAWWGRMLYPGADIPVYRATRVRVSPRESLLLRGGDLEVAVLTEGRAVDRAVLHFRVGASSWTSIALAPPFHHRLQGLSETTQFYATAGDGQSDRGIARVVDPPAVIGLRLRYHFPAYMGRPDQLLSGVSGVLSIPAGTRVELAMTASKPLHTATLEFGNRSVLLQPDGAQVSGAVTLWSDTRVRVRLQDTEGFAGAAPQTVEFHAVPDAAPVVQIEQPAGDEDVVSDASVPLHVTAADDYGLHRLWITHRLEAASAAAAQLPLADGERTRRGLDARARWNLAALSLRPGDVLLYRAAADDFDDLSGPHTGQSAEQRLRIVDRAEMERRLADGWAEWDQQLAQVIQEQTAARSALLAARTPAALAEAERRQRDLAPRADDLSRRAGELAEMARTNHLAAEATIARQERAGGELGQIATRAMPAAADLIRESASQPGRRAGAAALQMDIERRLAALRRQAQPDTDLEALARRAEELARAQAELEGQSQRLLPQTLGMNLGEVAQAQRGSLMRNLPGTNGAAADHRAVRGHPGSGGAGGAGARGHGVPFHAGSGRCRSGRDRPRRKFRATSWRAPLPASKRWPRTCARWLRSCAARRRARTGRRRRPSSRRWRGRCGSSSRCCSSTQS